MISKDKIINLLKNDNQQLFKEADKTRQEYVGNSIHLRGLIEFSNTCNKTCHYCGLRHENKNIHRYRLSEDEILDLAKYAKMLNLQTIVLQSGEDNVFSKDKVCRIIEKIKKEDVALTLSIGERSYKEYKAFKDAGADRYLLRIETTDKELYKKLHPNMSFEKRLECLYNIKEIGFETGTGCLVGLPEQTIESLANDIIFFKDLNADMIGVGPFIPHPNTPLGNININFKNSFNLALKVMAITRILLKDINIPATTAMETIHPNGRIIALQSGANVIMPNVTNKSEKIHYEIYPNKAGTSVDLAEHIQDIKSKIESIGRTISLDKGFRIQK